MWLAGGLAVVAAGVVLVALAFLEDDTRAMPRPSRRGTITADELRSVELPVAWRGYDRGHVDALLSRAARTLEEVRRYGESTTASMPGTNDVATHVEDQPTAAPAVPPSFLAQQLGASEPPPEGESGEELEDGRGDDAGGLDR